MSTITIVNMRLEKYLENIEDLSGRVIALTGPTSGIGLETYHHLIKKNAKVILLARNIEKAQEIRNIYKDKDIGVIKYDQSSIESIEKAIDELINSYPEVDTVILNAGILQGDGKTKDGYPLAIGVNYIGVKRFIDYLSSKITHHLRFVIQGSVVGGFSLRKKVDLLNANYKTFKQYNISKIYIESYFYKLYKENTYPNIEYVLTEPGVTSTEIIRHLPKPIRWLGKAFMKLFFHSPKIASLTLVLAASQKTNNGDFIVPQGLFSLSGYPKIKKFPRRRERKYLFE